MEERSSLVLKEWRSDHGCDSLSAYVFRPNSKIAIGVTHEGKQTGEVFATLLNLNCKPFIHVN